jgi:hypothetical protein
MEHIGITSINPILIFLITGRNYLKFEDKWTNSNVRCICTVIEIDGRIAVPILKRSYCIQAKWASLVVLQTAPVYCP